MATFTATDTGNNVQQPSLDLNRPTVDLATPILKGVEALAKAFNPQQSANASEILQANSKAYDEELTSMEEAGTLTNSGITKLNRKYKLKLQGDLTRAKAEIKDINAATTGFENIMESDKRYTTTKSGWITSTTDPDGNVKYSVNNKEEVQINMLNDAYVALPDHEKKQLVGMDPTDVKKKLESILDIQYRDNQLEQSFQRMKLQNDITEQKLEKDMPLRQEHYRSEKQFIAKAINREREAILASDQSPTEKARLIREIGTEQWLNTNVPGAVGRIAQLQFPSQDTVEYAKGFVLSETEIKAITTSIDNLDYETLANQAMYNRDYSRAQANLPPSMIVQAAIGNTVEKYAINSTFIGALLGEDTPEGLWHSYAMSSDKAMREVIAPGFTAMLQQTPDADNRAKRGQLLSTLIQSTYSLADKQRAPESILALDDVMASVLGLERTLSDWRTNPDYAVLRRNFDILINKVKSTSPKASAVWDRDKEAFISRLNGYSIEVKK